MVDFTPSEYWKAIILFGLNNATYKIGLAKTLLQFKTSGKSYVSWIELSQSFLDMYEDRLKGNSAMPQQANPIRLTVMERIIADLKYDKLTYTEAVERVGREAFSDVIPRFQTIGLNKNLAKDLFYEHKQGKGLFMKDALFQIEEKEGESLEEELSARWGLLEGAFLINRTQASLNNDLREVYLQSGYQRTCLTSNIPFLRGYQGGSCFYCGEDMQAGDIHVDHVLPRQVINHDEIWNLVLAHSYCNESKSDRLVGKYYMAKLITRNENIMGSNHPWKHKIELALGNNAKHRRKTLEGHYEVVKLIMGAYYWGGVEGYIPELDPFYRKLITKLNNG